MEFMNSLLHNVESLIYDDKMEDYQVCRVPFEVRRSLNPKARANILFTSGCEIRFVMEGDTVEIALRRMPGRPPILPHGVLEVFQGDYQGSYEISPWPVSTDGSRMVLRRQDWSYIERFSKKGCFFAPFVTRILLPYDWGCCIKEIRGNIRPPGAGETPKQRLLVYGSSITHGGNASVPSGAWAFELSRHLGYDLINLGCAGSAYMDPAMAGYIGSRDDWDAALFELGVNVIEEWDADFIYERACDFISAVKAARPQKPVFVTDMFYNHYDVSGDRRAETLRESIGRCVCEMQKRFRGGIYYMNGKSVMGSVWGLSSDGLHPSNGGHAMIARGLAPYIQDRLA